MGSTKIIAGVVFTVIVVSLIVGWGISVIIYTGPQVECAIETSDSDSHYYCIKTTFRGCYDDSKLNSITAIEFQNVKETSIR